MTPASRESSFLQYVINPPNPEPYGLQCYDTSKFAVPDDGVDNDCDDLIDEDDINGEDDDGDGLFDEDPGTR